MVLESIISPSKAEGKPFETFVLGFFYAILGFFLAWWIFKQHISLVMVFLTVIAVLPLFFYTLKLEEKKDSFIRSEKILIKEHFRAIRFLIYMFLGFVVAFSLIFVVSFIISPGSSERFFSIQLDTIQGINSRVSGNYFATGNYSAMDSFTRILINNLNVLFFCIIFSLIYGAGAIFILTWNASVISAAIGTFINNNLGTYASAIGLVKVGGYFHIASFGLMRYALHGIPEIGGYFIGGLAGGIVSVAISKHEFGSATFSKVISDALLLFVLAVVVLIIAALTEVFVTPVLF